MDTTHLSKPGRSRNRAILIALWLFFYASFTLFTPPLLDDADSVHAEVAREMLLRHDWVTLYANGIRYLEKAPLLYWSMAASFKLFGIHAAAARLPLALTVLALALALEAFARRAFRSDRSGLYAALILLSSFGIFIFTRITIPDAMVCLWLTLALYYYWLTEQTTTTDRESSGAGCPTSGLSDVGSFPITNAPGAPSFAASSRRVGCRTSNRHRHRPRRRLDPGRDVSLHPTQLATRNPRAPHSTSRNRRHSRHSHRLHPHRLTHTSRVPHLRDGLVVAKVGYSRKARTRRSQHKTSPFTYDWTVILLAAAWCRLRG
jgi:hypothetical protein